MNGFFATLLIIGVFALQGFITARDVDKCIEAGNSVSWCNHTFNR